MSVTVEDSANAALIEPWKSLKEPLEITSNLRPSSLLLTIDISIKRHGGMH